MKNASELNHENVSEAYDEAYEEIQSGDMDYEVDEEDFALDDDDYDQQVPQFEALQGVYMFEPPLIWSMFSASVVLVLLLCTCCGCLVRMFFFFTVKLPLS